MGTPGGRVFQAERTESATALGQKCAQHIAEPTSDPVRMESSLHRERVVDE